MPAYVNVRLTFAWKISNVASEENACRPFGDGRECGSGRASGLYVWVFQNRVVQFLESGRFCVKSEMSYGAFFGCDAAVLRACR